MKIGVPKESALDEKRVALIPESVSKLVKAGCDVLIEKGAGESSYYPDEDYRTAGASIGQEIFSQADVIVKVQKPSDDEVNRMKTEAVLIAYLQPFQNPDLIKRLTEKKITAFAMELVPRITRAQKLDSLSSMSTLAGYKAVLLAADASPKLFPMMTTAAGTLIPAKVFIIGAGVAGLQAIATARRLGAVVEAFDTRSAAKEQVESLGAKFAEISVSSEQTKDGYAKELSEESHRKEQELITEKIKGADIVITTALIPGKTAPCLITDVMVRSMRPGSVIVDLAAEAGGNCALVEPGKTVVKNGVTIIGTLNLPSLLPYHASFLYSRNIYNLLVHLFSKKSEAGTIQNEIRMCPEFDWNDEIISQMCVTRPERAGLIR